MFLILLCCQFFKCIFNVSSMYLQCIVFTSQLPIHKGFSLLLWTWGYFVYCLFFRSTSVSSMYLRCIGSFHISKHCQFIKDFSFFYGLVLPKRESFMNNKALLLFRSWYLCWNQKRTGKILLLKFSVERKAQKYCKSSSIWSQTSFQGKFKKSQIIIISTQ